MKSKIIRFSNSCLLSIICILIEKSKIKSHLILSLFVSDSVRIYSRYNLSDILNPSSKELGFMKNRISRKNIQRNLICDGSHDFLSQRWYLLSSPDLLSDLVIEWMDSKYGLFWCLFLKFWNVIDPSFVCIYSLQPL